NNYPANIVERHRKENWYEGPVIVKAERVAKPEPIEKAESGAPAASAEVAEAPKVAQEQSDETGDAQKTEDIPAAGPVEEKPEVTTSKAEKAESESQEKTAPVEKASQPVIAQASTEQPDETSTPREPVTRKAVLAPGAVRAIER